MLKFFSRCVAFGLLLLAVNMGIIFLSCIPPFDEKIGEITNSSSFQDYWKAETTSSMDILHGNPNADKAILGDSVMVNFLGGLREENPDWCIANGNASFLLIGQYAMLNEFLDTHPNATEVYLLLRPPSLGERLNGKYSYQFVVRPLANGPYKKYLTDETIRDIRKRFTPLGLNSGFEKMFGRSSLIRKLFLNLTSEKDYSISHPVPSSEAEQYLQLMFTACENRNVNLILLACPVADTAENRETEQSMRLALKESGLLEKMPFYFDSLLYYPPELFGDGVHFSDPESYRAEVFRRYQEVTGKMDSLFF